MKATLLGLEAVQGRVEGDGMQSLGKALQSLVFETPTGLIRLDGNRQAVADILVTEVVQMPDGKLANKVVKVVPQVNATLNRPREAFIAQGPVSRNNPPCQP